MIWPYKSVADLLKAGFIPRGFGKCPHCEAVLEIYQLPKMLPVFLNTFDHWPHLVMQHNEEGRPEEAAPPLTGKDASAGPDK